MSLPSLPPKRQLTFNELYVISQKTVFFMTAAARLSNPMGLRRVLHVVVDHSSVPEPVTVLTGQSWLLFLS
jgi:hypothetical protein